MSRSASYIWCQRDGVGRNDYVLFRTSFTLSAEPRKGLLHLFADTRYRLFVNGRLLHHGPGRFKQSKPEFDTTDLSEYLVKGSNCLAIMVCSLERGTFLSDPGQGALIAWGEVTDARGRKIELPTDPTWKALRSPAHQPLMPELSFAVGPGEHCDLRKLPPDWASADFDDSKWPAAVGLGETGRGRLVKRSIPMLDERFVSFDHCHATYHQAPESDLEEFGAFIVGPRRSEGWAALGSWVYSPKKQTCEIICAGSRLQVNGELPKRHPHPQAPMRTQMEVSLKKGWNRFVTFQKYGQDSWEFGMLWPKKAGLKFCQAPKEGARAGWLLAGPKEEPLEQAEHLFNHHTDLTELPPFAAPWKPLPKKLQILTPMTERYLRVLERDEHLPSDGILDNARFCGEMEGQAARVALLDFAGEVLGRPYLELTAPAGTVIDFAYTERLHLGRAEPWYQGTRMAERFICRGGRQVIHAMHPRGMRYLEVTIHQPREGIVLHQLGVTRALYPVEPTGSFECSDPRLNKIWKMGQETQAICMEDAYLDCPWRERGIYTGDILVQFVTNLACFGDHPLMRRCIELMLLTQNEQGMLGPCSHGLAPGRHPDYTAIAIRCMREFWARTGDLTLVRKYKRHMLRVLDALREIREPDSLLVSGEGLMPYIDSGVNDKTGVTCGLNCIVQGAFADAAVLLELLGEESRAAAIDEEAAQIAAAVREAFLDPGTGQFLDRRPADAPDTQASAVGNTLALFFNIAEEREAPLEFLLDCMTDNFLDMTQGRRRAYRISPYFSYYVLEVCRREGRREEAIQYIHRYWSHMLDHGAWTTWEFFVPVCSLCHAWSSSPTHHLTQTVLGAWYMIDGDPNVICIEPHAPAQIQWASGTLPHPAGPIHVKWHRENEDIILEYDAPGAVEVVTAPEA